MDTRKNAPLTPKGREVVEGGLSKAAVLRLRVDVAAGRHISEAVGPGPKGGLAVACKSMDASLAFEGEADDRQVSCVGRPVGAARQQLGAPCAGDTKAARSGCNLVGGSSHEASHAPNIPRFPAAISGVRYKAGEQGEG